jgi:NADH dehydrogenase FAD-containing subunit
MGRHLVLIGGGHAHMVTLANIEQLVQHGHQVTVVGPSRHHYYSGMGPGMLGGTYRPEEIRFATQHMVEKQGGHFILDQATRIDPRQQTVFLAEGQTLNYDVLSFNAGSFVPRDIAAGDHPNLFTVKPIEKLLSAQERIKTLITQKPIQVGIVGGGPSAAELAGNIRQLVPQGSANTLTLKVFCGQGLMAGFPPGVRGRISRSLARRNVALIENDYVSAISDGEIRTKSGQRHAADVVFLALGVKPSQIFSDSGLPTGPDGGLRVNRYLQCIDYPNLYGGGDCIYFEDQPLDKVGVYAVRQNPILLHNLTAALEERDDLKPFEPGGDYLLIFNMGGGEGVLKKRWLTFGGRLAFVIKDRIDRRFMEKFQALEK